MNVIHYGTSPFTYASGESGSPLGGDSAEASTGAEPSDEDFFPRFEAITSGSSEAVLFFPWMEGFSIPPFLTASFTEAVASLFPPSPSSEGATSSILLTWDPAWSQGGGPDT